MTSPFEILYRLTTNPGCVTQSPVGPVLTCVAEGYDADQLEAQFTAAGLCVVGVNRVERFDWNATTYDRDGAAHFLRIKKGTLSQWKASGDFPWSSVGLVRRDWLEGYILEHANQAAREIEGRKAA